MTEHNRPPRKRPAKILDYDLDQSAEYPPLASNNIPTSSSPPGTANTPPQSNATMSSGYVTELSSLKNEISQLKEIITAAVAQMKQAVESFQVTHCPNETSAMETEEKDSTNLALPEIIRDLKNDIATISQETRHLFNQGMKQRPKRNHSMEISLEILELIAELKHDIATVAIKMRAKFGQQTNVKSPTNPNENQGPKPP